MRSRGVDSGGRSPTPLERLPGGKRVSLAKIRRLCSAQWRSSENRILDLQHNQDEVLGDQKRCGEFAREAYDSPLQAWQTQRGWRAGSIKRNIAIELCIVPIDPDRRVVCFSYRLARDSGVHVGAGVSMTDELLIAASVHVMTYWKARITVARSCSARAFQCGFIGFLLDTILDKGTAGRTP